MKEIIYLDIPLVNSLLAQTNQGLVTKLINEETDASSNAKSGGNQTTANGSLGIDAVLKAETSYSETEVDNYSVVFSKSNKNLIETALDDYSLDVLLESLTDQLMSENYDDGKFILVRDKISIYNFKSIINGLSMKGIGGELDGYYVYLSDRKKYDNLSEIDKQKDKGQTLREKLESSSWNSFYLAKIMAEYMDSLFPNSTLIKIADTLSICDNEMIRMNQSLLSFNNMSQRKATVLGIVSSQITEKVPKDFSEAKNSDGLYRTATSLFSNLILGSNNIIKQNDFIVRPIAIFFENQK